MNGVEVAASTTGTAVASGKPRSARRRGASVITQVIVVALLVGAGVAWVRVPGLRPDATITAALDKFPDPRQVAATLRHQGDALVARNRAGWLAAVDPGQPQLVARFGHYYDLLTAMGVTSWQPLPDTRGLEEMYGFAKKGSLPSEFYVDVYFGYCWQTTPCPTASTVHLSDEGFATEGFPANVAWRLVDGVFRMSAFEPRPLPRNVQNLPWLSTTMKVAVGARVTVLADQKSTTDIGRVLADAEKAAKIADKYADWVRPARYVVYVAGLAQWKSWFTGPLEGGSKGLAYAIEASQSSDVVVINDKEIPRSALRMVLQHEFGHVVSRLTAPRADDSFLVEGFAEFVAFDGQPLSAYWRRYDVRAYFRSGTFKGNLDALNVHTGSTLSVSAAYGAGFYTWRCIQSRYGDQRMREFVDYAVRKPNAVRAGSTAVLGQSWDTVKKQCVSFIKRSY